MTVEVMPPEREDDTYWWVRTEPDGDWEVAQWFSGVWFMCGSHYPWPSPETVIVGPKIEPPA